MKNLSDAILFEDDTLIIVNKPNNLPTQSTQKQKRNNLYDDMKQFLKQREGKEVYLALHHRLDAATSGPVLFCKDKKFNKGVTDLFRDRKIFKKYLAVVDIVDWGKLKDEWRVENQLKSYKVKHFKKAKSVKKGDQAITNFKLLAKKNGKALLECVPKTGRLHQIRVHLSERDLPVVGDFHYNRDRSHNQLMLHSFGLEFIHPKTKQKISVYADPPVFWDDFFNIDSACY